MCGRDHTAAMGTLIIDARFDEVGSDHSTRAQRHRHTEFQR